MHHDDSGQLEPRLPHHDVKTSRQLLIAALLRLGATLALAGTAPYVGAQNAPICIDPPPIEGTPATYTAPAGWTVASGTPDIIAGNGPWPGGGGGVVSDISGTSTSGGTMSMFIGGYSFHESIQTTLMGLTAGTLYRVAVEWQQSTFTQSGLSYSGGNLRMTVDGNPTAYTSTGSVSGDTWQLASKTFVAAGPTAVLEVGFDEGSVPMSGSGMVVADAGSACALVLPPAPQPVMVPATGWGGRLVLLTLLAMAGVAQLARRRRQRTTASRNT